MYNINSVFLNEGIERYGEALKTLHSSTFTPNSIFTRSGYYGLVSREVAHRYACENVSKWGILNVYCNLPCIYSESKEDVYNFLHHCIETGNSCNICWFHHVSFRRELLVSFGVLLTIPSDLIHCLVVEGKLFSVRYSVDSIGFNECSLELDSKHTDKSLFNIIQW